MLKLKNKAEIFGIKFPHRFDLMRTTNNREEFRKFKFEGTKRGLEKVSGIVHAKSFADARYRIEIQNIDIGLIIEQKPWWKIELGKPVPSKDMLQFTRQLSSFASSGIVISRGLEVLSNSTQNRRLRTAIKEILEEIESGGAFSEAIAHQNRIFPTYFSPIIAAAERTGKISECLATLNDYLERDLRSQRAVKSALSYPIVLAILSSVAISVLSLVVLPRFESFFASLDVVLPLPTRILLAFTRFFGNWWPVIALSLSTSIFIYFNIRERSNIKKIKDSIKLKIPFFGELAELVAVERFCRIFSTLVRNEVPLVEALVLAGKGTSNKIFEDGVKAAQRKVLEGRGLAEPLEELKCFPQIAIDIFRVGEESGQLEAQLVQAAAFFSEELDFRMKNFTALIEPVVLLVLGGGIGFVAVALISAMYGIYSGVQS